MTSRFLDEDNELFEQLKQIKVTLADGSPSTTMDVEMRKAFAKAEEETKAKGKVKNLIYHKLQIRFHK
jgi:hypothetical protein